MFRFSLSNLHLIHLTVWWCLILQVMHCHGAPAGAEIPDDAVVATINGEVVRADELKHWMMLNRAEVFRYFYHQYSVRDASGFWENSYGGKSTGERLRLKALSDIIWHKVQQIMAREREITGSIDYGILVKTMNEENQVRQRKIAAGEVVYGPLRYTRQTYYAHTFDRMVEDLKAHLAQNDFKLDERALEELYHRHYDGNSGEGSSSARFRHLKSLLQMNYVDQQYQKLVEEMVTEAEVRIHQNVFEKVRIW